MLTSCIARPAPQAAEMWRGAKRNIAAPAVFTPSNRIINIHFATQNLGIVTSRATPGPLHKISDLPRAICGNILLIKMLLDEDPATVCWKLKT